MKHFIIVVLIQIILCPNVFALCDLHDVKNGNDAFKLAVPEGYIDACKSSQDFCIKQSAHFPETSKTVAFFLKPVEWKKSNNGKNIFEIKTYLIAQVAEGNSLKEFESDKKIILTQNGKVPDSSKPRTDYKYGEPYNLGIFAEEKDYVAFGAITNATLPNQPENKIYMASANIYIRMKNTRVMSLYIFNRVKKDNATFIKSFTKNWLDCLKKNK